MRKEPVARFKTLVQYWPNLNFNQQVLAFSFKLMFYIICSNMRLNILVESPWIPCKIIVEQLKVHRLWKNYVEESPLLLENRKSLSSSLKSVVYQPSLVIHTTQKKTMNLLVLILYASVK